MLRRIISALLLLTLVCASAYAAPPALENGGIAIIENSGANRYKSIRLVPEIYNHANSDLSDLRLKDGQGGDVPYFINSGQQLEYDSPRQAYPMTLINSYTKDGSFYFDYKVSDIPDRDIAATSLELTTQNSGFAKNIELSGSYDNINWEFVQQDTLYSIGAATKLTIDFTQEQKYTHYRFKLANNLEKISFDSAVLIRSYVIQEKIYFVESMRPAFSVEEKDKLTYINIEGLKNLRLAEITIASASMFKRYVGTSFGMGKELYNLTFNDTSYTDTTISFERQISRDSNFSLMIDNGDDKPINISGLTVKYYADDLVFAGDDSEQYTLVFGADHTISAPVYDIERYKLEILSGDTGRLAIKEIRFNDKEEPPQDKFKMIFNIVVIVVAVVLGALILIKLRKKA